VRTTSSLAVGITTAEGSAMLGSPLLEIIFPFVQIMLEVDVIEYYVFVSHLVFSDVGLRQQLRHIDQGKSHHPFFLDLLDFR